MSPYLDDDVVLYTADGRLDQDPSPGQLRVRKLAQHAATPEQLAWALQEHAAELRMDRVLGRHNSLTGGEEAYTSWQYVRSEREQDRGALKKSYRAQVFGRGERGDPKTLIDLYASMPPGGPALTGTQTIHALFHGGFHHKVIGGNDRPHGTIYPDEGIVDCGGGAHRTGAHVVAGVLLTPELEGDWEVRRTEPDPELLYVLELHARVAFDSRAVLPFDDPDLRGLRAAYLDLAGPLEQACEAGFVTERPMLELPLAMRTPRHEIRMLALALQPFGRPDVPFHDLYPPIKMPRRRRWLRRP